MWGSGVDRSSLFVCSVRVGVCVGGGVNVSIYGPLLLLVLGSRRPRGVYSYVHVSPPTAILSTRLVQLVVEEARGEGPVLEVGAQHGGGGLEGVGGGLGLFFWGGVVGCMDVGGVSAAAGRKGGGEGGGMSIYKYIINARSKAREEATGQTHFLKGGHPLTHQSQERQDQPPPPSQTRPPTASAPGTAACAPRPPSRRRGRAPDGDIDVDGVFCFHMRSPFQSVERVLAYTTHPPSFHHSSTHNNTHSPTGASVGGYPISASVGIVCCSGAIPLVSLGSMEASTVGATCNNFVPLIIGLGWKEERVGPFSC